MFIDITIKNYRSIKEEQKFSLIASPSKSKLDNTFIPIDGYENLRLLKSAVFYGANGSGKSNLIRLIWTLRNFVTGSTDLKAGDLIPNKFYDPFLLDKSSKEMPTEISIFFIPRDGKRYRYIVKYNKVEVLYEYLGIYETNWISKIYERKNANEFVEFGDSMKNKKEDKRVLRNNLFLSKFGNIPNDQLTEIYLYFKNVEVWNIPSVLHINKLYNSVQESFNLPGREKLRRKLSKLINIADTKITGVEVAERPDKDFENLPDVFKEQLKKEIKYETFGIHKIFVKGKEQGFEKLSFNGQESQGTRAMFAIGGLILDAFEQENSIMVVLDEFDNSLHPELAKFLVDLFHNPKINKNNSQLIIATHETTLLDKTMYRKDQIWFCEKNNYGMTEIYSVNDFKDLKNIRSDIPFEKWYKTGKFGAVPNIKKFEFIAEYE